MRTREIILDFGSGCQDEVSDPLHFRSGGPGDGADNGHVANRRSTGSASVVDLVPAVRQIRHSTTEPRTETWARVFILIVILPTESL